MDAALIFQTEPELDQSLYFIVEDYEIRVLVMSLDEPDRDPYQRYIFCSTVEPQFKEFFFVIEKVDLKSF